MRRAFLRSLRLPAAVMAVGMAVTLMLGNRYERVSRLEAASENAAHAEAYTRALEHALTAFIASNQGLAAHITASGELKRHQFERYIYAADGLRTHEGLGFIGYAPRVPYREVGRFERSVRSDYVGFRVTGMRAAAGDVYPMLHAFPSGASTEAARGLDQSGVPSRREAMRLAASGSPVATAPHLSPVTGRPMLLVFTPVRYPTESAGERDDFLTVRGFVFSEFAVGDVIDQVIEARLPRYRDVEIYDVTDGERRLVHDADGIPRAASADGDVAATTSWITFGQRRWEVMFFPDAGATARGVRDGYALIILSGLLLSAVLAWLSREIESRLRRKYTHGVLAAHLHRAFEHHPAAVYYLDLDRRFVNANDKAISEFGYSREELVGMPSDAFIAPEKRELAREQWRQAAVHGQAVSYDSVMVGRSGQRFDARVVLVPMIASGHVAGVLGVAENITEIKQRDAELRASRRMLQSIVDHLPLQVFWKDAHLRFLGCNRAFAGQLGVERVEDLVGRTDSDLHVEGRYVDPAQIERYQVEDLEVIHTARPMIGREALVRRQDGSEFWARTSKVPLVDENGMVTCVLGVAEDITERKVFELRLQQMAHYDSLTGLANRGYFLTQLEQAVRRSARNGGTVAVLYFDIDRFKSINDTWGHDVGDKVIGTFAERVKRAVREVDVVGRVGGDEFVVLSEGLASPDDVEIVARRLVETAREPMRINDELELEISTSVGIAFHRPGVGMDELVQMADQAMYAAKRAGGNQCAYATGTEIARPGGTDDDVRADNS